MRLGAWRRACGGAWIGWRGKGLESMGDVIGVRQCSASAMEESIVVEKKALTRLGRERRVSKGYWDRMENQRALFDSVAEKHNVRVSSDWKRVRNKDVSAMGGAPVLARYESFAAALQAIYPEEDMSESVCRAQMPRGHWKSLGKRRKFIAALAESMEVKKARDWRRVRYTDVRSQPGGRGFLEQYPSLFEALKECWNPKEGERLEEGEREHLDVFDMRDSVPQKHWESKENVVKFIERLGRLLNVKEKEDWYRVSWEQVQKLGGARLLAKKLYLVDALRLAYPNETWEAERFSSTKKKAKQRQLFASVSHVLGIGTANEP